MPLNCPQAISKLKAYKQQHQNLQNQFDEFLSQVPYLPDVKWDEPFMSSPHYKDITNAPKNIFDNLYDAKEEARKRLGELKDEIGYQKPLTEKEFFKLTQEQKIDYLYLRCFKPTQYPNQEPQYQQPIPDLRRHELEFLYDNHKNKKFSEIIIYRDEDVDMLKIFDCAPDQIVHDKEELQQAIKDGRTIKAYVGELFSNIFQVLPQNIEYIYTEFPEGKIRQKTIKLGTGLKTKDDFVRAIEDRGGEVNKVARGMMAKKEFGVSEKEVSVNIFLLPIKVMGLNFGHNDLTQIFNRAKKRGLELCPPEIGPQLRLQYQEKSPIELCKIGMDPISDVLDEPKIFRLHLSWGKYWLDGYDSYPNAGFSGDDVFVFIRNSNPKGIIHGRVV